MQNIEALHPNVPASAAAGSLGGTEPMTALVIPPVLDGGATGLKFTKTHMIFIQFVSRNACV